ncbi:E3 ubiquitin ligase PARAQUAT TOLERANCE 3-like [Triticum dicoccoides]|uniref:E3 ubiquitin ligase PARAQUAT TOLERANCE 3-like n=1 Tax=Triticum dicoccoides TaxID=85692 RepID=UPI000E7B9C6C|nr:E3 ubiquitin ligase PARAQUAT TOLERANCE 3-like [Triticum dicoccoides]
MGVLYYKYKSAKETYPVTLPYSFISVPDLKQLILSSNRHGTGRSRGRGPREDIALSNAQTGEEYAEDAMIPQNVTVLVRRTAGQESENIVVVSSRKVIEDGSIASNRSVVTESVSKSCSSAEVKDEDAAIAAVIDAAELKWEEQSFKRGQAPGRFTSGRHNGHGSSEREAPPPGYVCRSCGVAGHFIQHCPQENQTPPPGYTCYRCRIPGHFIQHCPTIGDSKFDNYKMSRPVAPVVSPNPADDILSALAPAASASVVDDLPAELHCQLCNKVMADAVLTSKCCFVSFCDKCIRDYIITQSKCICGVKVLADSLIPNPTVRSTISNLLGTRTCSTASGTGKHRSSSGSNPDPKSQSHTTSAALERDTKQCMDNQLSAASPDARLQVATEGDQVDRPQKNSDLKSNTEGSAGRSVEKAIPGADLPKLKDVSESTLKNGTISGSLEPKVARPDQLKKKRKKADSSKAVHPNNADYGYNVPFGPAYCNPFNGAYPMGPFGVPDPYMYGSMGMPYGGFPMGPFGMNPYGNIPPQALAMQGYPPNYQSWENQAALHRDAEAAARSRQVSQGNAEAAARSRQTERPNDSGAWPRPSDRNQRMGSPQGRELRDRPQSRPEPSERNQRLGSPRGRESRDRSRSRSKPSERSQRSVSPRRRESRDRSRSRPARSSRDHGRSDRGSSDYHEDHHDRKRMRVSSTVDGDTESSQRSRHSSRSSLRRDDASDDEQNFKRKWGR